MINFNKQFSLAIIFILIYIIILISLLELLINLICNIFSLYNITYRIYSNWFIDIHGCHSVNVINVVENADDLENEGIKRSCKGSGYRISKVFY